MNSLENKIKIIEKNRDDKVYNESIASAIRYIMAQPVTRKMMIGDINEYLDQLTGEIVIGGAGDDDIQLCNT